MTICTAWPPVIAPSAGTHSLLGEQAAQPLGAEAGERVLDRDRAAQALDVGLGVGALDGVVSGSCGSSFGSKI